jgi:hypothetical protein
MACTLALVVLFAAAVSVAAAAGTTDIGVSPDADTLEAGENTAVQVIVESADGGVGAINATVTFSNPDVASVETATIHGDPGLESVTERDDGVTVSAALADTDDTGAVTIVTLVVRGESPGTTGIDIDVRALGDEDGTAYDVAEIERPTLSVTDGAEPAASNADRSPEVDDDVMPDESSPESAAAPTDGDPPDSEGSTAGSPDSAENGAAASPTSGPSSLYGPAGALGLVALGALAIYRFR